MLRLFYIDLNQLIIRRIIIHRMAWVLTTDDKTSPADRRESAEKIQKFIEDRLKEACDKAQSAKSETDPKKAGKLMDEAAESLGRGLHALQDTFAHTNGTDSNGNQIPASDQEHRVDYKGGGTKYDNPDNVKNLDKALKASDEYIKKFKDCSGM